MTSDATTQGILDRLTIQEVINRYFYALDARDWAKLQSCFAPDASVVYYQGSGSEKRLKGSDMIVGMLRSRLDGFTASTHTFSNVDIQLDGSHARCETRAVASVVIGDRVLVRGLKYVDVFDRTVSGWTITSRAHVPLWQYEAANVTPTVRHGEK